MNKNLLIFEFLQYFGLTSSTAFWMNIASKDFLPLFTCQRNGFPLNPPLAVRQAKSEFQNEDDWRNWLHKNLPENTPTLPKNFPEIAKKIFESSPVRRDQNFEIVFWQIAGGNSSRTIEMNRIAEARITESVANRVRCEYDKGCFKIEPAPKQPFEAVWLTLPSPYFHEMGFAKSIGYSMITENDQSAAAVDSHGIEPANLDEIGFRVGDCLEAVDPANPQLIRVASVIKLLRRGFMVIGFDEYKWTEIHYVHKSSKLIFPPGFCAKFGIELFGPAIYMHGTTSQFNWNDYKNHKIGRDEKFRLAAAEFFDRPKVKNQFKVDQKVEAVDEFERQQGLIAPATIVKVVDDGRLLKIHFDGWQPEFAQWMDCESPDIFPVGYCEATGQKLEWPGADSMRLKKR